MGRNFVVCVWLRIVDYYESSTVAIFLRNWFFLNGFTRNVITRIIESVGLSILMILQIFCWRTSQIRCFFETIALGRLTFLEKDRVMPYCRLVHLTFVFWYDAFLCYLSDLV